AAQPPPAPVPVLPGPAPVPFAPQGPGPTISRPVPVITQPTQLPPPGAPVTAPLYTPPPYNPTPPPPGPAPQTYGACAPEPLMFFNTELQFVAPSVANRLTNTVVLPDGTTKTIA